MTAGNPRVIAPSLRGASPATASVLKLAGAGQRRTAIDQRVNRPAVAVLQIAAHDRKARRGVHQQSVAELFAAGAIYGRRLIAGIRHPVYRHRGLAVRMGAISGADTNEVLADLEWLLEVEGRISRRRRLRSAEGRQFQSEYSRMSDDTGGDVARRRDG